MIRVTALVLAASAAWSATADDLLKQVDESLSAAERRDPTTGARGEALAAVALTPGLSAPDRRRLQAAVAGAWLEARRWDDARQVAATLAKDPEATPTEREAAALTWLTAWHGAGAAGDPVVEVATLEVPHPRVLARALSLRAQVRLAAKDRGALTDADAALLALADADPAERVPLLAWRITAMEVLGADATAVQQWLLSRAKDPAVAALGSGAPTTPVGRPAPPLVAPRLDGIAGTIDFAAWRQGRPVAVAFVASWSEACASLPAMLRGSGRPILWVALDGPETLGALPAWGTKLGITTPIIGQGKGWDGDLDDAWQVEQIPAVVFVDATGHLEAPPAPGPGPAGGTGRAAAVDEVVP